MANKLLQSVVEFSPPHYDYLMKSNSCILFFVIDNNSIKYVFVDGKALSFFKRA